MADAERFVRQKEAMLQYYGVMSKARQIMSRAYAATPEGKAEAKRAREEAAQRRKARAEAAIKRAAEVAEIVRKEEERRTRLAELKAAREARTERDLERERRSRIKWSEMIDDEYVVKQQIAYERRTAALAMNDAGLSSQKIGERFGVSRGRANQLVQHAWREREAGKRSPAEVYFDRPAVSAVDRIHPRLRVTVAAIVSPRPEEADWIWMGLAA